MPRDGKSTITVDDETIELLKEEKPDNQTWDTFLQICCVSEDANSSDIEVPFSTARFNPENMDGMQFDTIYADHKRDIEFEWVYERSLDFNWPIVRLNYDFEDSDSYVQVELSFNDKDHLSDFGERLIVEARRNGQGSRPETE